MDQSQFTIDCTGDVVVGDTILFTEAVFKGSWKNPTHVGDRTIAAKVTKDSYGEKKQQHTFTLKILSSEGTQPLIINTTTRRKGRNVYKNGTNRMPWANESDRQAVLDEKHERGGMARAARDRRLEDNRAYYGFK